MDSLRKHFTRCLVAGIVSLLPVAGLVLTVVYFESVVASSWLKEQGFYFFGQGLMILVILVYLVGLVVSSVIGNWLWRFMDRTLDRIPVIGNLYQTVKQLLGYGEGANAMFRRTVLVSMPGSNALEIGLLTCEATSETAGRALVFLPNAPTPTSGRLILIEESRLSPCTLSVNQAMQTLISLGAVSTAGFGRVLQSGENAPDAS